MRVLNSQHLIFDGQIFQTSSWHRGMGKYSYSLILALMGGEMMGDYKSITILLNKNLKAEEQAIDTLKKISPRVELFYADLEIPSVGKSMEELRASNKVKLTAALTKKGIGENIDYFILSLFLDETCVVFPDQGQKLLLFYDLIPFLYSERYKKVINFSNYLKHFATIFEADTIFTISQTVADDLKIHLGILENKICNIDGASIDRALLVDKQPNIDVSSNFILMPSGDEQRKNNLRAVKGFEIFNSSHDNKYKLVISSNFGEHTKEELNRASPNIIFTGNIPEDELQWLYKHADLLLFASEYEGLGLPVLEGMSTGRKIACSYIPVFREISSTAFYFFDHFNPALIAKTLDLALSDSDWESKRSQYAAILNKYSWEETARKCMAGIQNKASSKNHIDKPKVAIFTPHPAGFSAIGKVVSESHDAFSQYFDINYYFDFGKAHKEVRIEYLSSIAKCYDAKSFNVEKYSQYDTVIYHIGNSHYHFESIKNALYLPGYAILHDTFLEGVFNALEGIGYLSMKRIALEKKLDEIREISKSSSLTSITNNQLGIVTHSNYSAVAVNELLESAVPIRNMNLPVATATIPKDSSNEFFQIGLAGIMTDLKGLSIIEKIASSDEFKNCVINVFGFTILKPDVIEQFKKWPRVKIIPNPSDFEFQTCLSKLDVLINYRLAYMGETSLTTIEAMRYGVVVVVRDIGWYSELPADSVVKASSEEEVVDKVYELYQNKSLLSKISAKAKLLIKSEFTHEAYAHKISDLIAASKAERTSVNEYEENIKTNLRPNVVKGKNGLLTAQWQ